MDTVTSADGTVIAFDRAGQGPPVILVCGATAKRADPGNSDLAQLLAGRFTTYNYDRRGRGDSTDTAPYAVEREVEDIAALVAAAGGTAYIYGISSGGVLAFEAARRLPELTKLAVYEPPFIVDDGRPPRARDYVQQLDKMTAEGRRGDAVVYFMIEAAGIPAEFAEGMRAQPFFPAIEAVAHTIAYDGRVMGDTMYGGPLPAEWASFTRSTLVVDGGNTPWLHAGSVALGELLPNARHVTLGGQDHNVDPDVLAPVLIDYFAA
ncbi:MAG TPA: alpha/beta hydrolase [Streptosporangiaceae bacterium]